MQKKHLGIFVAVGAVLGAVVTFLTLHKPTREKVKIGLKTAQKTVLKTVKEKANKIKVD